MDRASRRKGEVHHYTDLALLIMWYLILVIAVALLSAWLRRLVTVNGGVGFKPAPTFRANVCGWLGEAWQTYICTL